jgi:hypothetical protein
VCDRVVPVGDGAEARAQSRGARIEPSGELWPWSRLAPLRIGLVTALARPSRVLRFLAARGVIPSLVVSAGDHGGHAWGRPRGPSRPERDPVELWLATAKCATHWAFAAENPSPGWLPAPLAIIDYRLELSAALRDALTTLAAP